MQFHQYLKPKRHNEDGQTLIMFTFFVFALILFLGLAIDLGFAYITKSELSKAVDSGCLAGLVSLNGGTNYATEVSASTFYANYPGSTNSGRDAAPVQLYSNLVWQDTCQVPNQYVTIGARATINTYFIRAMSYLYSSPTWQTLSVNDSATATRQHLIVSLVLDHSGSMSPSCTGQSCSQGGTYLPGAVTDFISNFEDNYDEAAMISFGTFPETDFQMSNVFKQAISTAASNLQYIGGTFSLGGLVLGSNQLASVNVPGCEYAVKVVVFFTDGQANMITQAMTCPPSEMMYIGGYDSSAQNTVGFFRSTDPITQQAYPDCYLSNGGYPSCCSGQNYFTTMSGAQEAFLRPNVSAEAEAECISLANAMRANGWYVFCIGLSAAPADPVNQSFLLQVANDPASPTYNSKMPTGQALIATQADQLNTLFNQIADQILLRLTQ
jgi:Flp pilus assembly protein TadG